MNIRPQKTLIIPKNEMLAVMSVRARDLAVIAKDEVLVDYSAQIGADGIELHCAVEALPKIANKE